MPRHRHTFEQIRLPLIGDMNRGEQGILHEGEIGYFPEGQTYGPQDDPLGDATAVSSSERGPAIRTEDQGREVVLVLAGGEGLDRCEAEVVRACCTARNCSATEGRSHYKTPDNSADQGFLYFTDPLLTILLGSCAKATEVAHSCARSRLARFELTDLPSWRARDTRHNDQSGTEWR
jgi:hypothetical protein